MQKENIKSKVLSGLFWKFSERISAQLVTFIVSIALARILEPSHYGAIAIVNVFIALANVFVVSGFGNSLIQKSNSDNLDYSSVLYANILLSVLIYIVIFFTAPVIARFYNMDILSPTLRVLGLRLIVAGINNVQHAYVSQNMLFKRFFWSTLFGTIVSGIVGLVMAYRGFGIWALVAQYMTNICVDTIVLWFTVDWRPILAFSFDRLKSLFSYGWKLLISSFLDVGYNELRTMIIGKLYSSSDLAFYNKGKSFPTLIVTNINSSIQSVMFPALSNEKDNKITLKLMTRRSIRISSYIMLPLMIGLALVAEPFVKLLLTEKWLFCVPFLQISCFTLSFMPIHTANLEAIKAVGRSDIFLKLETVKKVVGILLLFFSMRYGVIAIALTAMITTLISSFLNAFPNKKLINYSYIDQLKDMLNGFFPLVVMSIVVYMIGTMSMHPLCLLSIQVLCGACTYIFVSYVIKNESFIYLKKSIKSFFK